MFTVDDHKKILLVVAGPTAVGKTDLAIRLAAHFATDIISADSRQFYKEMRIGTAVPTRNQLKQVPHHFIQHISIEKEYDVATYEKEVLEKLHQLFLTKKIVVITGGSGLYIDAVCLGIDTIPETKPETRLKVSDILNKEGLEGLQKRLQKIDPQYFEVVDQQNPRRLQRALEVYYQTGKTYSFFRQRQPVPRDFDVIWIGLRRDRTDLINRINLRVEGMIADGLFEEAEKLFNKRHLNALNTVGYKEIFNYLKGNGTIEEAVEQIKIKTRQYAKRQMTWFNKNNNYQWFHPENFEAMVAYLHLKMKME
ncbi:MAG: tRNA (adenosine(37)-N6)-dimethylallyltransferase MiaA [Bacteroidetes bacterium HGW-Bacteroidetes-1]|jgi:tRNA dimethylallyltransferase|nr:MAG: tRNA (adenosine(37)-N6)-dimethylallyltransferase MiaA [Bacteroidetes bacterium HGW-Bacteroidetes-1]